MNLNTPNTCRHGCHVLLVAAWFASASALAQSQAAPETTPSATMPMGKMHQDAASSHDMKASMMMGMDHMQKVPMSGDTDKDFAAMMKIHHQQALNMAELELAKGKSPEMKSMATQIIAAQKQEIAQFDKWLAKQK